jgi:hypothetical protein
MAFTAEVPNFSGLSSFTDWWSQNSNKLTKERQDYYTNQYINPLKNLIGWDPNTGNWDQSKWPTYNPIQWGDPSDPNSYAGKYAGYQQGMSGLLARLGAGPQSSDMAEANQMVGYSYGMSPASWTALQQGMGDRLNASNVMGRAASMSLALQESDFGKQQAAADAVAMRQAEEAVGKQLEAIFGERGGLAGFQAAYDMTSKLQSSFLQQKSQENLALLDRSLAAVNAENGYYQQLIQNGSIQAQDYLKFRWSTLQTGYQDYLVAMDQTMKEWTTQEQVAEDQYNTAAQVIKDQVNAITAALSAEMGVDQQTIDYMKSLYDLNAQQAADKDAANNPELSFSENLQNEMDKQWETAGPLALPLIIPETIIHGVAEIAGC